MNISQIQGCFGCGVCSIACRKGIIDFSLNEEGFYSPTITDVAKCTNCGLCIEVCSFAHKELAQKNEPIASYGAWSQDNNVRRKCSSGGVGFEIGRYLLGEDYEVVGCRYNVKRQRAEHYIAKNTEELVESIGSKYIQSYTSDAFSQIDRKKNFLVIGTPCQIDSFRRYIQKFRCEENFILMDFFCHGVPSYLMWRKYIEKFGFEDVTEVRWRDKRAGWHDSWNMVLKGIRKETSSLKSKGDMFYKLFLSNLCLGKACYKSCKFKNTNSSADIRIGDFWGKTYRENEEGVSSVIAFTEKGDEILHKANVELINHPIDVVAEGQLKRRIHRPLLSPIMMWFLRKNIPLNHIFIKLLCSVQMLLKRFGTYYRIYVRHKLKKYE